MTCLLDGAGDTVDGLPGEEAAVELRRRRIDAIDALPSNAPGGPGEDSENEL